MNQEKKISVCLPFYNIEPYVSRCLDSVLDNTYQNLEVICVNDGSTDGSLQILQAYQSLNPRFNNHCSNASLGIRIIFPVFLTEIFPVVYQ